MNISLNTKLEKYINQKVEEGNYNSASEVVRDALRLMIERETFVGQKIQRLNKDIEVGLNQLSKGEGVEGKAVFQELRDAKLTSDQNH